MVNCNPNAVVNHCSELLFNDTLKTQGHKAALALNTEGACCLEVHVGSVPHPMTAQQAAIAQHKHVAMGWPIQDQSSAYHCQPSSHFSAQAAAGIIVPWHDPDTGIVYEEGCLVKQVSAKWTKPSAILLII